MNNTRRIRPRGFAKHIKPQNSWPTAFSRADVLLLNQGARFRSPHQNAKHLELEIHRVEASFLASLVLLIRHLARLQLLALVGLSVQPRAEQRDDGADLGLHAELVAEEHDGRADDDDALDHVAHAVRHGAHARQRVERELVVQVVQQAHDEEPSVEGLRAEDADRVLHAGRELRAFKDEDARGADEDRDEGGVGVDARGAEVLYRGHGRLGPDGAEAEGEIRRHRCQEAQPVERQLRCGRK
eukprot:TRINITY_DN3301_c0_g1_i2.p2 TRINITY_DN3301_c0_g1~~TRINITY_DN3301_c0_g1_i2.p2  ORF type:complete len:242 (+),score=27.98 TRINITY_DN3301_c0_g1_i2:218-943(+)